MDIKDFLQSVVDSPNYSQEVKDSILRTNLLNENHHIEKKYTPKYGNGDVIHIFGKLFFTIKGIIYSQYVGYFSMTGVKFPIIYVSVDTETIDQYSFDNNLYAENNIFDALSDDIKAGHHYQRIGDTEIVSDGYFINKEIYWCDEDGYLNDEYDVPTRINVSESLGFKLYEISQDERKLSPYNISAPGFNMCMKTVLSADADLFEAGKIFYFINYNTAVLGEKIVKLPKVCLNSFDANFSSNMMPREYIDVNRDGFKLGNCYRAYNVYEGLFGNHFKNGCIYKCVKDGVLIDRYGKEYSDFGTTENLGYFFHKVYNYEPVVELIAGNTYKCIADYHRQLFVTDAEYKCPQDGYLTASDSEDYYIEIPENNFVPLKNKNVHCYWCIEDFETDSIFVPGGKSKFEENLVYFIEHPHKLNFTNLQEIEYGDEYVDYDIERGKYYICVKGTVGYTVNKVYRATSDDFIESDIKGTSYNCYQIKKYFRPIRLVKQSVEFADFNKVVLANLINEYEYPTNTRIELIRHLYEPVIDNWSFSDYDVWQEHSIKELFAVYQYLDSGLKFRKGEFYRCIKDYPFYKFDELSGQSNITKLFECDEVYKCTENGILLLKDNSITFDVDSLGIVDFVPSDFFEECSF